MLDLRREAARHICIYGLTAAGKTTHAKLLAQQFNCDYISASQLMFDELDYYDAGDHATWLRNASEISARRESGSVDRKVNQKLLSLAERSDRIVFDSWTLPFMVRDAPGLRNAIKFLKLESDEYSRAVRAIVSLGPAAQLSMEGAIRLISEKDESSRRIFASTFGFDIFSPAGYFPAHEQFHVDVSSFVYGTSPGEVRHGVADAHQRILQCVLDGEGTVNEATRK
jgi:cytidylate kinase